MSEQHAVYPAPKKPRRWLAGVGAALLVGFGAASCGVGGAPTSPSVQASPATSDSAATADTHATSPEASGPCPSSILDPKANPGNPGAAPMKGYDGPRELAFIREVRRDESPQFHDGTADLWTVHNLW